VRISEMLMSAFSNDGIPSVLQLDRGAIFPELAEQFPSGTNGQPLVQQPVVLLLGPWNMDVTSIPKSLSPRPSLKFSEADSILNAIHSPSNVPNAPRSPDRVCRL
jgi:hypothetical protein